MFALHCHTGHSNASRGFADSSIKIEDLVKRAIEKNLNGIAVTDHETVASFVMAKNLEKKHDFPVICGDEIYLVSEQQYDLLKNEYEKGMYFPHFLLLALNRKGNEQLRRLSTRAWTENGFWNSGLYRTPTKMSDIEEIIGNEKGNVVASSACLGGQIPKWIQKKIDFPEYSEVINEQILDFIYWCKKVFGEDNFFLEMQPSYKYREITIEGEDEPLKEFHLQYLVNQELIHYSQITDTPLIITSDAHYLDKELLKLHSKFLNSTDDNDEDRGRNVESIYETAYLMSEEEVLKYFKEDYDLTIIQEAINNTNKIGQRAERYEMSEPQEVPKIDYDENWKITDGFFPNYGSFTEILSGDSEDDKYLLYRIEKGVKIKLREEEYKESFRRLDEELHEILEVSKAINKNLGNYFITMEKLIEIIWTDGDSIVGVGRGSCASSILAYLLDIIQINPLKIPVEMPFWRFITKERSEMTDIDIDTQSNRRLQIFNAVKKYFTERGGDVVNCATFGTIGAKSAIQTAGRGLGLLSEETQAISSLIPSERGVVWSLYDTYYGNEKEGRRSIKEFVNLVDNYEGLLELAMLIESVIISRSVHASGIFITNGDFNKYNAKMIAPNGIITSQWDLHESEQMGLLKYDFLTTEACTKIRLTMDMLIEANYIERKETLKETYMSVLNPHIINYNKPEVWDTIANNEMVDLFQFSTPVAMQTVSTIKPRNLIQLAQANSLMRLQKQPNAVESPMETYVRFKNNIDEWYQEMTESGVPVEDQKVIERVLRSYEGVADSQEAIMLLSRLEEIGAFTVKESHMLRKSIAKKSPKDYEEVKELFFKKCKQNDVNINTVNYIWNVQVDRQRGYSFSILHCIVYTFIALQELILYTQYPSIYWNCACLTVNAGAIEEEENSESTEKSTKYGEIAQAIGNMKSKGVKISIPHINEAKFSFTPNKKDNEIIFGLKGIVGIGDEVVYEIIKNRPYTSLEDFHARLVLEKKEVTLTTGATQNKSLVSMGATFSLIKAGGFDKIENIPREDILKKYILMNFPNKTTLDMRTVEKVADLGIVPENLQLAVRVSNFKKYIVSKDNFVKQDDKKKSMEWYKLKGENLTITDHVIRFFEDNFLPYMEEKKDYYFDEEGNLIFSCKLKSTGFEKQFDKVVAPLKEWLKSPDCLNRYNEYLFKENLEKYGSGSISKWEMDSLSFYYHEHELACVDKEKYLIENFEDMNEEPLIEGYGKYKGREYPKFKISRIAGTVLDKDKTKHTVSLLTVSGEVVLLKMYSGQFGFYDKEISQQNDDGTKTKIESGWFKRGTKLLVTGYRLNDQFKVKRYKDSALQHAISYIEEIREDGVLVLKNDRTKI